jgi:thiamine biosynthesis lipoprotein
MRRTELIMGMPVTVVIPDRERQDAPDGLRYATTAAAAEAVFSYLRSVDERFSPYRAKSETSRIDRGALEPSEASAEMQEVLRLSEDTRQATNGFFDVWFKGRFDPSGLVKGWAVARAAKLLDADGFISFCIEAGGDIEVRGANEQGLPWAIGLRSPTDPDRLVRTLRLQNRGIATSGTYIRGEHIYNPLSGAPANELASLTVVASDVYEADRFATAAFAMGREGIAFLAGQPEVEGYMIEWTGIATYTPGFARYLAS